MKKILPALLALTLSVAPAFADDDADASARGERLRDLDPAMNEKLKNAGSTFETYVAADWIFDLGSDAPAHDGWGFSTGIYAIPDNPKSSDWHSRWGASFHYFSTTGAETIGVTHVAESVDAGYIAAEYGLFRNLGKKWEAGMNVGLGVGAFFGESDDGTSVDSQGNFDAIIQVKPEIAWKPTDHLRFFVAYKFAYMTPFYNTTLIGYRSVSFTQSALEAGVTWRF